MFCKVSKTFVTCLRQHSVFVWLLCPILVFISSYYCVPKELPRLGWHKTRNVLSYRHKTIFLNQLPVLKSTTTLWSSKRIASSMNTKLLRSMGTNIIALIVNDLPYLVFFCKSGDNFVVRWVLHTPPKVSRWRSNQNWLSQLTNKFCNYSCASERMVVVGGNRRIWLDGMDSVDLHWR